MKIFYHNYSIVNCSSHELRLIILLRRIRIFFCLISSFNTMKRIVWIWNTACFYSKLEDINWIYISRVESVGSFQSFPKVEEKRSLKVRASSACFIATFTRSANTPTYLLISEPPRAKGNFQAMENEILQTLLTQFLCTVPRNEFAIRHEFLPFSYSLRTILLPSSG